MGIEGIARHQGSLELVGGVFVEQALGDGKFAVVLFAAVGALREGLAGGVETECHDASEPAFGTDGFAVQREGFGQHLAVFHQPVPCLLFMDWENDPKRVVAIDQKLRKVRRAKGKPLVLEVVGLVESEASRAVTVIQKDQRLRQGYGDQAGYAGVIVVRDVVRQVVE